MKLGPHGGRIVRGFLITGSALLLISIVEFALALALHNPSGGANIGGGLALLAMIQSTGAILSSWGSSRVLSPPGRVILYLIAAFLLVMAAFPAFLLVAGFVEHFTNP